MNTSADKRYIEAVFKHSIDIDRELHRITLFMQFQFRSLSREPVEKPEVIINIEPKQAILSGKILPPELIRTLGVYTSKGGQTGWSHTSPDWFKESRRTGEYHISPIVPITLHPGVWYEMNDWQVEFDWEHANEPFYIRGWVGIEGVRYPVYNPIFINFSS